MASIRTDCTSLRSLGSMIAKRAEIEVAKDSVRHRLDELAQETLRLQSKLRCLEDEDSILAADCANLRNYSDSPILRIPNEMTCRIFEIVRIQSSTHYDHPDYDPMGPRLGAELTLSSVCRHWRTVCLATPVMWSHLILQDSNGGQSLNISSALRLSTYLERSQQCPLDIVCSITRIWNFKCDDILRHLFSIIIPHSHRWQRLVVWADGIWTTAPFSKLADIEAPQLEIFEVGKAPRPVRRAGYYTASEGVMTIFKPGAPKLTSALLFSDLSLQYHGCCNLSTVFLKTTRATILPWTEFLKLIALPQLVNLTLDGGQLFAQPQSSEVDTMHITAPRLRHFRLGCDVVFSYMWEVLTAPALELLVLFDLWSFRPIFQRDTSTKYKYPSLKTLVFWNVDWDSPQTLLQVANASPHVTDLTICACPTDSAVVTSLYQQSLAKNKRLWPGLRNLSYVVGREDCFLGEQDFPASYQKGRKVLLELVEWRQETFGVECNLWIKYPDYGKEARAADDPFKLQKVPLYDDSEEEREQWKKHLIPEHRRFIPWPDEETIRFGYHERQRFSNWAVRGL